VSQVTEVEIYLPRIRFKRSTRRGPVWFTEALFPNYLFARFDLVKTARHVISARGVSTIVHFGDHWPQIPDDVINDLRATVTSDEVHVVDQELQAGEEVVISGGAFHDLKAVITRVLPARDRVAVLIDFLGRLTMTEVPVDSVVRTEEARKKV
jgi:transcriptional antiterminator RfaH